MADLGDRDRGGAHLGGRPTADPRGHPGVGCRSHQLRQDVGIKDDHPAKLADKVQERLGQVGPVAWLTDRVHHDCPDFRFRGPPCRAARMRSNSTIPSSRFLMLSAAMAEQTVARPGATVAGGIPETASVPPGSPELTAAAVSGERCTAALVKANLLLVQTTMPRRQ